MNIIANGTPYDIPAGMPLADFLAERGLMASRVVVERNGAALTPAETRATLLAEGDRLEIVRVVAGG